MSRIGPAGGPVGPVRSIVRVSDPKLEIQMLHDRVMVRVVAGSGERRSSAGIVIPATAQIAKRLVWGEVFGVGNHVRTVKVGNRVLFNPEDQFEFEVHGQTYLVVRERDLKRGGGRAVGGRHRAVPLATSPGASPGAGAAPQETAPREAAPLPDGTKHGDG